MTLHNFPSQPTSFVGRTDESSEIKQLLIDPACRLLTLVGPGGIGKTRLAIKVASNLEFEDGVFFVPLQPLSDITDIVSAIINVLPLQISDRGDSLQILLNYLAEPQLLLLLDNFEHLLDGVSVLTQILNETTRVKLLVTSRERLDSRIEQIWPVAGLDILDDEIWDRADAVRLFVNCVRRVKPDFVPAKHKEAVIRICKLVEGMPLALELAASWVRVMPCGVIADEIQKNIALLRTNQHDMPERHRSMRTVLDYSWQRLTKEEQAIFCKLSVFIDGFTLEAAQQVAGASLQTIASLIDKSLVKVEDEGRYSLHELLRQYAEEQLEAVDAIEHTNEAHCHYYVHMLEQLEPGLKDHTQKETINKLERELGNLELAWEYVVKHRRYALLERMIRILAIYVNLRMWGLQRVPRMIYVAYEEFETHQDKPPLRVWGCLLALFSYVLSHPGYVKSVEVAQLALESIEEETDKDVRAFVQWLAGGTLAWRSESKKQAITAVEESLTYYTERDVFVASRLLLPLSNANFMMGHSTYGKELSQRALMIATEQKDVQSMYSALGYMKWQAILSGEVAVGLSMNMQRRDLAEQSGDLGVVGLSDSETALWGYFGSGNYEKAFTLASDTLQYAITIGDLGIQHKCLLTLSLIANIREDYIHAHHLLQNNGEMLDIFPFAGPLSCSIAICAYGRGDYKGMIEPLDALITTAFKINNLFWMTWCLPILVLHSYVTHSYIRTIELMALALTHPVSLKGWLEKWPMLSRLQEHLRIEQTDDVYNAAWERGTKLDLEDTIVRWLTSVGKTNMIPSGSTKQPLIEPLTKRELEVLAILPKLNSYREIAEELTIVEGTVRTHAHNIFQKLGVKGKTQAVLRAKELGLL